MLLGGSRVRTAWLAAAMAAVGLFGAGQVAGQQKAAPKPPPTPEEFAKINDTPLASLTVRDVQGNVIVAENFAKEPRYIYLLPDKQYTRISVKGTAEASALRPGMFVRFTGTVDEKGAVAAEVAELELVSADSVPDEIAPDSDTTIGGKILKIKEGKVDIQTNVKKLKKINFSVSPSATITVNMTDLTAVRPGDSLSGSAKDWQKNLYGADVQVTMANPLTGPKKKTPPARPSRNKPGEDDKDDDAKPDAKKE